MCKLFQKFLACFLSFLMIYTSVVPSYAQAAQGAAQQRAQVDNLTMPGNRVVQDPKEEYILNRTLSQCPAGNEACTTYVAPTVNLERELFKGVVTPQAARARRAKKQPEELLALAVTVEEAVKMLTSDETEPEEEKSDYEYFQEVYLYQLKEKYDETLQQINREHQTALRKCKRQADQDACKDLENINYKARKAEASALYKEAATKASIADSYRINKVKFGEKLKEAKEAADKEALEQGQQYLQKLAHKVLKYKNVKDDEENYPLVEKLSSGQGLYHVGSEKRKWPQVLFHNMVEEAFPVFLFANGLTETDLIEARRVLRQEMDLASQCSDKAKEFECGRAVKAAQALTILGDKKSLEDRAAFEKFMRAGIKAYSYSAEIILTGGIALLEFNGYKEFVKIVDEAAEGEHHWTEVFNVISVTHWMDTIHQGIHGKKWFLEDTQWSGAYMGDSMSRYGEKVVKSAWTDLGRYLAVQSYLEKEKNGPKKRTLDLLMQSHLIVPTITTHTHHGGEGSTRIGSQYQVAKIVVKFPAFIQGVYEGFYELPDWNHMTYLSDNWKKVGNALANAIEDKRDAAGWQDINTFMLANLINMGKTDLDGESYREVQYYLSGVYVGQRRLLPGWQDIGYDEALRQWRNKSDYKSRPGYLLVPFGDDAVAAHQAAYDYITTWRKIGTGLDITLAVYGLVTIAVSVGKLARMIHIARTFQQGKSVAEFAKLFGRVRRLGKNLNIASAREAVARANRSTFLKQFNDLSTTKGIRFETKAVKAGNVAATARPMTPYTMQVDVLVAEAQGLSNEIKGSVDAVKNMTVGAFGVPQVTAEELQAAEQLLREATAAERAAKDVSGIAARELTLSREIAQAKLEQLRAAEQFYKQWDAAKVLAGDLEKQVQLLEGYSETQASMRAVKAARLNAGRSFEKAKGLLEELRSLQTSYVGKRGQIFKLEDSLRELQTIGEVKIRPLYDAPAAQLERPSFLRSLKTSFQTKFYELPTASSLRTHGFKPWLRKTAAVGMIWWQGLTYPIMPAAEIGQLGRTSSVGIELVEAGRTANDFVRTISPIKNAVGLERTLPTTLNTITRGSAVMSEVAAANSGLQTASLLPGFGTVAKAWSALNVSNLFRPNYAMMMPSLMGIDSRAERALRASGAMGSGRTNGVVGSAWGSYLKEVDIYAAMPQYREQQRVEFNQLQQRQFNYLTGNAAIRMDYERQGYPITGKIQSGWQTLQDYFYLKYVAPWTLRMNPLYQARINAPVQAPQAAPVAPVAVAAPAVAQQATPPPVVETETRQPTTAVQFGTTPTRITATPSSSASTGYLYSGLPIFTIGDKLKNVWQRLTRSNRVANVEEARAANAAHAAVLASAISLLAALAGFADFVAPAVALLKDSLGLSTFVASLVTLSGFGMFGLSIPFGKLQSQLGRIPMMRIGLALSTLGLAIPSFVLGGSPLTTMPQFWTVLGSIALLCAGSTILKNAASALAFDVAQTDAAAASMLSSLDAWKIIPTVLNWVLPTVVLAANGYSWTLLFPIYGAISLAGLVASMFMNVAESAPEAAAAAAPTEEAEAQPATPAQRASIGQFIVSGAVYIAAEIFALSNTPILLTDVFGMTAATANVVTLSTIVAGIFASRFAGTYLPARYLGTPTQRLVVSSAVALAGLALVMTGVPALSIAGLFLTGFGYGNIFPMLVNLAQSARPTEVDRTTSLMMTSIAAGGATPLLNLISEALGPLWSFVVPAVLIAGILGVGIHTGRAARAAGALPAGAFTLDPLKDTQSVVSPAIPYAPSRDADFVGKQWARVSQRMQELAQALPMDKMSAAFPLFRGMTLNSLEEVKNVLTNGLELDKSGFQSIYFASNLRGGTDGSSPLFFASSPNNPTIPVLVVRNSGEGGAVSSAHNYTTFDHDVSKEGLSVFAYLQHEGKAGWYQMTLQEDGNLLAVPVETYLTDQLAQMTATAQVGAATKISNDNVIWSQRLGELGDPNSTENLINAAEEYLIPAFPSDMLKGQSMIYRGQPMSLYTLNYLFADGLLMDDYGPLYLSYDPNVAIHYSRDGMVPTVFGYSVDKQFVKTHPVSNDDLQEVRVESAIPVSDLDFVACYLTVNGKEGWYQVSMDQDGKLLATPLEEHLAAKFAPNMLQQAWDAMVKWFQGFGASEAVASQTTASAQVGSEAEGVLYLNPQKDTRKVITRQVKNNTSVRTNRLEELYDALPAGFEAEYGLFRGMTLNTLAQLDNILVNGLEVNKTSVKEIDFSSSLIGEDPGSAAAIAYASRATHPNIPVIVTLKSKGDAQIGNVYFEQDIPASAVDIYAYLTQDGKGAWYHMSKEADGSLKAVPAARYLQEHSAEAAAPQQEGNASAWSWFQTFVGKISNAYHKAFSSSGNLYSSFIPGIPQFLKFIEALGDEFSSGGGGAASSNQGPVIFGGDRFTGEDHSKDPEIKNETIPLEQLDPMPADARSTTQELEEDDQKVLDIHGGREAWDMIWNTVFSNHGKVLMPWHYFSGPRPSSTVYLNKEGEAATNPLPVPENIKSFIDSKLPAEVRNNPQVKQTVILDTSDWHGEDITELILFVEQCFKTYGRENVLVLFGGDGFTGSYLLNAKPEWGLSGLVNMGVDVFTMGNHEADVLKTFTRNITLLNIWNSNRSSAYPSLIGTAPAFIAGKQRILLGSGIETLPYTIKVSGNGERIAVIGLGKAGYGNELYPIGKREQAQEALEQSLAATVSYLERNNVDHILVLMHESLNDTRKDTHALEISAAIKKMPEKLQKLIRVVYEGHTHTPENTFLDGINYVNPGGFPKKTLGLTVLARDGVNGTTYSYSTVFDTANREKVPAGQADADDNPYKVLHLSYQAATQALQKELKQDPDQPIVQLIGPLTSRVSKSSIYLEPAIANAVADGFYWNAKRLSRTTDNTGVTRILRTPDGKPIDKQHIIGAATYMNTGKPMWQDVITLAALTGYFPNPEPFAVRPITGKQFIQFVHDNFLYVGDPRDGSPAQFASTYAFSHNIRIAVSGLKTMQDDHGKTIVDASQVKVAVYVLGAERKYIPMDPNDTYYMAMPHHMMVGLYESALFRHTDLYGPYDYIYKEQKQSFSEMMNNFFKAAAISNGGDGYQKKATPPKFYNQQLEYHADANISKFKTFYWKDENGTWKEFTEEDETKFFVSRDKKTGEPTVLYAKNEQGEPIIKDGQIVKFDVQVVPLFYTHIGRIVNLDELLKGQEPITQKQLDLLYNGAITWEDVFGPIAAPEADPTELPGEDNPSTIGGTPAASPAGAF